MSNRVFCTSRIYRARFRQQCGSVCLNQLIIPINLGTYSFGAKTPLEEGGGRAQVSEAALYPIHYTALQELRNNELNYSKLTAMVAGYLPRITFNVVLVH